MRPEAGDQFRALFAANPRPMWVFDREDLAFLEVNDAALRMYGFSRDEFLRMVVTDVRLREDAVVPHDRVEQAGASFGATETRHRLRDGRVIWVRVESQDLDFGGRPARLCALEDITARRAAEEQSAQFAALIESSEDGVTARDRDGRIVVWSPAAERLYGYTAAEVLGKRGRFLEPPDRGGEIAKIVGRVLAGEHIRTETVRLRKSGGPVDVVISTFPVFDHDGCLLGIGALHRDIGERKRRQEEIRRLVSILDATTDFVGTADPDGNTLYLNRAARRMLGLGDDEDISGRRVTQDHPASVVPAVMDGLRVALKEGVWEGPSAVLGPGGSVTPTSQVILAHRGPDGVVRYFSTIARDITERMQAEASLLERTHQLATLLDVSYNVASVLDLEPLLGTILDQLQTVVGYSAAAVLVLEGECLAVREYRGDASREEVLRLRFHRDEIPAYREILQTGAPIIDDDLADPACAHASDPVCLLGVWPRARSWMGVPLQVKGRTIGLFCIDHAEPNRFSGRDVELTLAIANHAALSIEHAQLYEQAQQFAVAEERQRLARELHDSVTQEIYAIGLSARAALSVVGHDTTGVREALTEIHSLAETGLAEMRALIFELRPEALAQEGLVASLGRQRALIEPRHGIRVEVDAGPEPAIPLAAKEALYRIAREALQNVVKHASASEVRLTLRHTDDELVLEVSDDGVGFEPTASFPGHLGLQSMRERAARLGATADIRSAPGCGTSVRISVPAHDDQT